MNFFFFLGGAAKLMHRETLDAESSLDDNLGCGAIRKPLGNNCMYVKKVNRFEPYILHYIVLIIFNSLPTSSPNSKHTKYKKKKKKLKVGSDRSFVPLKNALGYE